MGKILVTPRSITAGGHPQMDRLTEAGFEVVYSTPGKQPDEAELIERLPGCVGYLAGVEPITAAALAVASDLKVISRNGTGVDNIDHGAARRAGIEVYRAEGANARGVVELTLAMMFSLARSVPFCDARLKAGQWERRKGIELQGRTLGVVGCGRIGREVAELAICLGMNVLGFDVVEDPAFAPGDAFRYASLDDILRRADVITLHCPAPADGSTLIDAAAIAKMRPGVLLINTARANLIDESAVRDAIQNGHIAGVATDVFATEPPTDRRLIDDPRVIASPHVGGFTVESVDRAVGMAVDNLLEQLTIH